MGKVRWMFFASIVKIATPYIALNSLECHTTDFYIWSKNSGTDSPAWYAEFIWYPLGLSPKRRSLNWKPRSGLVMHKHNYGASELLAEGFLPYAKADDKIWYATFHKRRKCDARPKSKNRAPYRNPYLTVAGILVITESNRQSIHSARSRALIRTIPYQQIPTDISCRPHNLFWEN